MKRFERLERPRGDDSGEPSATPSASAKRFETIAKPDATNAPASDPFAPPADTSAPVQLALHDAYSEQTDEAKRTRQRGANQALAVKQAEVAARATPHHAPGVLDVLVHGLRVGPLAKLSADARVWLLLGGTSALAIVVGVTAGSVAAIGCTVALLAALAIRGWRTRRY